MSATGNVAAPAAELPAAYTLPQSRAAVAPVVEPVVATQAAAVDYAAAALAIQNWTEFVAQLRLSGMAGMLAKQCEFKSFESGVLELAVPLSQKHLADKPYQDKLRAELAPRLGTNFRLNIRVADTTGASLAAHEDRVRTQQQADAEGAIEQDPFIRGLRQEFGAEVLPDSVRPAGQR